ncbi:hypothetical protein [Polaribacter sp.]|uniref:hypothetical protein n=1 Tax=Polaribacter sp. TaxID=1920175 RepID=UPI003F6AE317
MKKLFILFFIFLFSTRFFAQDVQEKQKSWYAPDYASLQFAGNIGLFSTGIGYEIYDDIWFLELLYGYIPESITKAKSTHLITLKNTFPIFTKKIKKEYFISPIAGFTATYDATTNTFTTLPSQFTKGYYVSNAIHFVIFGGFKIHKDFDTKSFIKGIDFYYEIGTVESYLWYAITSKQVPMSEAFSSAIGVNFYF